MAYNDNNSSTTISTFKKLIDINRGLHPKLKNPTRISPYMTILYNKMKSLPNHQTIDKRVRCLNMQVVQLNNDTYDDSDDCNYRLNYKVASLGHSSDEVIVAATLRFPYRKSENVTLLDSDQIPNYRKRSGELVFNVKDILMNCVYGSSNSTTCSMTVAIQSKKENAQRERCSAVKVEASLMVISRSIKHRPTRPVEQMA
ncbi:hypothetical protein CHUAL_008407 [Chamberlinius hualienensis]